MIARSIGHGLSNLIGFNGRDRRSLFWPYAAAVVLTGFVALMVAMTPIMTGTMARARAFAQAHPDRATITEGPGHVSIRIDGPAPGVFVDTETMALITAMVAGLVVLLLAAAVTRRLHDTGRNGWWGLPPVVFLALGLALMPIVARGTPAMGPMLLLVATNLLYLLSIGVLAILLLLGGTSGDNRYGAPSRS